MISDRLEYFGGRGAPVVFAHANGYPPGSYRQFIAELKTSCEVTALRHRPLWAAGPPQGKLNWHCFADDLLLALRTRFSEPVWVLGHSMGAVIALLAASRAPELFRGLLMVDPVFLPTRRTLGMRLSSSKRIANSPMIRKTLARPNRFVDHQSAFDFHRGKRPYAKISDEVLWDYINAGTRAAPEGGLELSFPREWEAGVYASPPWVWARLVKLKLPTLGLRGEHSDVLTPKALARWRKLQPGAELHDCPGGHLLPLEQPVSTANFVTDYLLRQPG